MGLPAVAFRTSIPTRATKSVGHSTKESVSQKWVYKCAGDVRIIDAGSDDLKDRGNGGVHLQLVVCRGLLFGPDLFQ